MAFVLFDVGEGFEGIVANYAFQVVAGLKEKCELDMLLKTYKRPVVCAFFIHVSITKYLN